MRFELFSLSQPESAAAPRDDHISGFIYPFIRPKSRTSFTLHDGNKHPVYFMLFFHAYFIYSPVDGVSAAGEPLMIQIIERETRWFVVFVLELFSDLMEMKTVPRYFLLLSYVGGEVAVFKYGSNQPW